MADAILETKTFDVIVVGAGAAGLLGAARSAQRGRTTLLLEKNRKPGVKILMSGGTRCNLTHDCDERGIIAGFGSAGSFLHSPLAALGPRALVRLFEEEGLFTKVEPGGKVFPLSDRALDVQQALVRRAVRSGVVLQREEEVRSITRADGNAVAPPGGAASAGFYVETTRGAYRCQSLLITTGGQSYPGCGTTGDGYRWLRELGHTIREPRPALVPLTSNESWVRELSGVTIPDCRVRVVTRLVPATPPRRRTGLPPGVLIERRGSLLLTHFGLSGPVILDVSRAVTAQSSLSRVVLEIDFLPDASREALGDQLAKSVAREGRRLVSSLSFDPLPKRLIESLLLCAGIPETRRGAELSRAERESLITWLKQAPVSVSGSRGFAKAEVTAGGVALDEVDSRTMRSKLVPGLYLAGEILDLDGFIGGYNFQAAFSTGWVAGSNV